MKTQASFEIRTYIEGRINLNISQTHNELYQIYRTSAVSKTLVFRWHKKFQDGFTNHKDGSRPGQPKTIVTNANIAAVAGRLNETPGLHWKILLIVLAYYRGQLIRFGLCS